MDCQTDKVFVSGAMLSPLLTGEVAPARNTAKACCPSRVRHAFGVIRTLWRNCEGAPKAWHPRHLWDSPDFSFLTINNIALAVNRAACRSGYFDASFSSKKRLMFLAM